MLLVPLALAAASLEGLGAGIGPTSGTIVFEQGRASTLPVVSVSPVGLPFVEPRPLEIMVSGGVAVFSLARSVLLNLLTWVQETVVQRTASMFRSPVSRIPWRPICVSSTALGRAEVLNEALLQDQQQSHDARVVRRADLLSSVKRGLLLDWRYLWNTTGRYENNGSSQAG